MIRIKFLAPVDKVFFFLSDGLQLHELLLNLANTLTYRAQVFKSTNLSTGFAQAIAILFKGIPTGLLVPSYISNLSGV